MPTPFYLDSLVYFLCMSIYILPVKIIILHSLICYFSFSCLISLSKFKICWAELKTWSFLSFIWIYSKESPWFYYPISHLWVLWRFHMLVIFPSLEQNIQQLQFKGQICFDSVLINLENGQMINGRNGIAEQKDKKFYNIFWVIFPNHIHSNPSPTCPTSYQNVQLLNLSVNKSIDDCTIPL